MSAWAIRSLGIGLLTLVGWWADGVSHALVPQMGFHAFLVADGWLLAGVASPWHGTPAHRRTWAAVGAVAVASWIAWHVPPLFDWGAGDKTHHVTAHLMLLLSGVAVRDSCAAVGAVGRAFLFIWTEASMTVAALWMLSGSVTYASHSAEETAAAGVAMLLLMPLAWLLPILGPGITTALDRLAGGARRESRRLVAWVPLDGR